MNALIVAGATVTTGANLDATKLTGNLPEISGADLTSLPGSPINHISASGGSFGAFSHGPQGGTSTGTFSMGTAPSDALGGFVFFSAHANDFTEYLKIKSISNATHPSNTMGGSQFSHTCHDLMPFTCSGGASLTATVEARKGTAGGPMQSHSQGQFFVLFLG